VGQATVKVNARADAPFQPNQEIWLRLSADTMRLLDKATGRAL
jgi:hypothetical protein